MPSAVYPTHVLEPGTRLLPAVQYCRHRWELPLPTGALPRRRRNTRAELYAALRRKQPPRPPARRPPPATARTAAARTKAAIRSRASARS